MQKRCGVPSHQCSVRGTTKRPRKTWNRKTRRVSNHATHLTYSAFLEDWSFSNKAKYARLRTPRGPRMGLRESSSIGFLCCRRQRFRRPRTTINREQRSDLFSIFFAIRLRPMASACPAPAAVKERCAKYTISRQRLSNRGGRSLGVWMFGGLEVETRRGMFHRHLVICPRIDTNFHESGSNPCQSVKSVAKTPKPPNIQTPYRGLPPRAYLSTN